MKDFILDSTYKDAIIVNRNDDIFTISSSRLPNSTIPHHSINLINTRSNSHSNLSNNNKFNTYNLIDYL